MTDKMKGLIECDQQTSPRPVYVFDPDMLAARDKQVKAVAWDEGYYQARVDDDSGDTTDNPYREES